DTKRADFVEKVVKVDLRAALKMVEEIEDFEAKSIAFLHVFKFTNNEEFLGKAISYAIQCKQRDGILLMIVESIARCNRKKAEKIAELIQKEYYKNKAYATILEECNAIELAKKITCKRILSSSLKRISLQTNSIEIAMEIPDPYYKALALISLAELKSDEKNEKKEIIRMIKEAIESIKSEYLKKRLKRKLKSIDQ
ncbi:hypothetical protein DRO97_11275, partial [Archaeoglobales archaeon]